MVDAPHRERETLVTHESSGSSGAWIFGIVVAILAAFGIWYFATGSGGSSVEAPATSTEAPAASAPAESAPPAPAETAPAAPAAPTDGGAGSTDSAPAPATPAPADGG